MIADNTIILGHAEEWVTRIEPHTVDLVIIDPPYEFHRGQDTASGIFKGRSGCAWQEIEDDNLNGGIPLTILPKLDQAMRATNIYIWCNKSQIHRYLDYYDKPGIAFEILTWHKENPTPLGNNGFLPDTEYLLYFRQLGAVRLNDGYKLKNKYWTTPVNTNDKNLYDHPTIKPLPIIQQLVEHSSKPGDLVLDCYLGSGTTAVAAQETGRRFIGIEINPRYYQIAVDRMNGITASGQMSIFTDNLLAEKT